MPPDGPTSKPPCERRWIRSASEWGAFAMRRNAIAIRCDMARAVEQRQKDVIARQYGKQVAKRRCNREPYAPPIPIAGSIQDDLMKEIRQRDVCCELPQDCFGEHQVDIVLEAALKAFTPMRGRV